ncbi:MAG TPA: anti-sigma factor [Bacillales bacterium]|nr:anti-sigma factor [Bacillales bacterium]
MADNHNDRLIDYFNGDLDEVSSQAFEKHLAECSECREELEELEALTQDLPFASEPTEPPEGMKERVLANVFAEAQAGEEDNNNPHQEQESKEPKLKSKPVKPAEPTPLPTRKKKQSKRRMSWLTPLIAAALLLSLLGNAYTLFKENQGGGKAPGVEVAAAIKSVQLQGTEAMKNSKGKATLLKTDTGGVRVVVSAENLEQLQGNNVYQVWLIDDSEKKHPYRAGTFVPDQTGGGAVSYTMDLPKYHTWDTIAITLEPTPNSQKPKGNIVLASQL